MSRLALVRRSPIVSPTEGAAIAGAAGDLARGTGSCGGQLRQDVKRRARGDRCIF